MADEGAQAAVLFADVSGSTKLYETAGDQVAKAAIDQCIAIMREKTEACQGRVIKTIGDEVMASFPSSDQAADAAIQMQESITELKASTGARSWCSPTATSSATRSTSPRACRTSR
jgi:adenylate cyclase